MNEEVVPKTMCHSDWPVVDIRVLRLIETGLEFIHQYHAEGVYNEECMRCLSEAAHDAVKGV